MNGITGANGAATPQTIPVSPQDAAEIKASGFGFAEKGGVEWDQWIDSARRGDDQKAQVHLMNFIALAGGRSDNASIKQAMYSYEQFQRAASPNATAADQLAALRGMSDQLMTSLTPMGIASKLTGPLEGAARQMLVDPTTANTPWGKALDRALATPRAVFAFQEGVKEGILEGGKSLVMSVVSLAGKTLQYGADTGPLGWAGDRLRGITGKMPGWLETVTPSQKRGEASTDALKAMGSGISNYLSSKSAGEIAGDIKNALGDAWDGLAKDYEAAKALGREDEARWLGKTIGRIGFEVGATFIPVAGQAGKVSTGVRVADAATDGARLLNATDDAARLVTKGADAAADIGRAGDKVADGGRVTGKLDDVAGAGARSGGLAGKADDVANGTANSNQISTKLGLDSPSANKANPAGEAAAVTGIRTIVRDVGRNRVEWTVDAQGRLLSAKATLKEVFEGLERSAAERLAQSKTAAKGLDTDHGGHAIPHRFLGDQGDVNMFPQNGVPINELKNFNGSAFKTLENELADWVKAGGKVEYEVKFRDFDPKFPDRPNTVSFEYKVYNEKGAEVYRNADDFENKAGQVFKRVSNNDISTLLGKQ